MILENISKTYTSKYGDNIDALKNINLFFDKGLIILLGVSGAGKSTLLNIVSGLDNATEGKILVNNTDYTKLSQKQWDEYRLKEVGVVFQESNLIADLDVYDNLALPLKLFRMSSEEIDIKVKNILDKVGLQNLIHRKVWQLSSGQKQRIAIARGLIKKPSILILDEPTGNLDADNGEKIFELLHSLKEECLIIVATHDEIHANKYADRIITLQDGHIKNDKQNKINGNKIIDKIRIKESNSENERILSGLDNESIVQFVKNIILDQNIGADEKAIDLDIHFQVRLKEDEQSDVENKEQIEDFVHEKKTGLPFAETFKFALNSLKVRKVRLSLTILLFMLSISLILLSVHLFGYEYKKVMAGYMTDNYVDYVIVHRNAGYKDIFENDVEEEIACGKNLIEDLSVAFGSGNIKKVYYLDVIRDITDQNEYFDIPIMIGNYDDYDFQIIGEYPQEDNEVLISSNIAKKLFPDENMESIQGKNLYYQDIKLRISGVVKEETLSIPEYVDDGYIIGNMGFIGLVDQSKDYVKLRSSSLASCNALNMYVSSNMKYGSLKVLAEKDIIWGRMPEKSDEVVVSKALAAELGYDLDVADDFQINPLNLINLEHEKYNRSFDCINMYSYFPEGIHIVGIYDTFNNNKIIDAEVLIEDEKYQSIKNLYYQYYCYQELVVHVNDYKEFVQECDNLNIIIEEQGCSYIYGFNDFIENIEKILIIFLTISISIALFFLITFLSYSVRDQARKIGILRTLGLKLKDTVLIFFVEAMLLTSISMILGFSVFYYILFQINNIYDKYMINISFDIVHVELILSVGMICLIYIASILASYVPLHKMSKQNPIELINK